jgi:periplasmic divalent cation tolerance protein
MRIEFYLGKSILTLALEFIPRNSIMTDKIVVFTTCGSEEEARKLAAILIEKHLAACVNITAPLTSVYRWKGKVEESREWLLIIKSRRECFDQLRLALEGAHSYELPEVLAIPVVDGSPTYLAWLDKETESETGEEPQ